jgi:hypothetical protein
MRMLVFRFIRLRDRGGMASSGRCRQGVCQLHATVELSTINEGLLDSVRKVESGCIRRYLPPR